LAVCFLAHELKPSDRHQGADGYPIHDWQRDDQMRPLTDRGKEQAAVAREAWFGKEIGVRSERPYLQHTCFLFCRKLTSPRTVSVGCMDPDYLEQGARYKWSTARISDATALGRAAGKKEGHAVQLVLHEYRCDGHASQYGAAAQPASCGHCPAV